MSEIISNLYLSSIYECNKLYDISNLIVNAAIEINHPSKKDLTVLNLNWMDDLNQDININGNLFYIIKIIDIFLNDNKKVIVNCYAGISRSSTIVIAFLIAKKKMSLNEAINFVRMKRNIINPNINFIKQLSILESQLLRMNLINIINCPSLYYDYLSL